MARKIKCPGFLCGSADVEYLGGNQRTSINLNLLHPFTLVNTKPSHEKYHGIYSVILGISSY